MPTPQDAPQANDTIFSNFLIQMNAVGDVPPFTLKKEPSNVEIPCGNPTHEAGQIPLSPGAIRCLYCMRNFAVRESTKSRRQWKTWVYENDFVKLKPPAPSPADLGPITPSEPDEEFLDDDEN